MTEACPETALMQRVVQGDVTALEVLYDRYAPRAYSYALRLLGKPYLAEEAVQATFVTVWARRRLFDSERSSFASWFFAILRSRCIDLLRKEGLHPTVELSDNLLANAASPEERVEFGEVRHAVLALPDKFRQVLLLAYFGGYSHSELARMLQLPLGTVKSRLRLALEHLAEALERRLGR